MAYRIRHWAENYEVNDKGGPWRPGDQFRQGPLDYIRIVASGAEWRPSFRDMLLVAGKNGAAVFGVFIKLLEIAGRAEAKRRGWLLNRHGEAATVEDLARMTGFSKRDVARAMDVLTDPVVRWVEIDKSSCVPGMVEAVPEFREFPAVQERKRISNSSHDQKQIKANRSALDIPEVGGGGKPRNGGSRPGDRLKPKNGKTERCTVPVAIGGLVDGVAALAMGRPLVVDEAVDAIVLAMHDETFRSPGHRARLVAILSHPAGAGHVRKLLDESGNDKLRNPAAWMNSQLARVERELCGEAAPC